MAFTRAASSQVPLGDADTDNKFELELMAILGDVVGVILLRL